MKKQHALWIIFISAILLRIILHVTYTPWWVGDSVSYLRVVNAFLTGNFIDYDGYRTPGFPFLIGALHFILNAQIMQGDMMALYLASALTIVQSMLGLAAIYFAYLTLGYLEIAKKVRFYFVFVFALLVPVAKYEMIISSESLSIFMVSLSLYLLIRGFVTIQKGNASSWLVVTAGLISGLSVLVRPNNLVLYGVLLISILFFSAIKYIRQEKMAPQLASYVLISSSAAIIPLILWMLFNYFQLGVFNLTPMASISKTLAAYNLFDHVKTEDRLIGSIMQKYYLRENSGSDMSRDYVWRAMPELRKNSDNMPFNHGRITNQRVYLASYLGQVSNYLLRENPSTWLRNGLASFSATWTSFQYDFEEMPSRKKYDPISPDLKSVVKNKIGWYFLLILNALESAVFIVFYFLTFAAMIVSAKKYLSTNNDAQRSSALLIFSLALAGIASFIVPCFFTAFFPRYGVPFYVVLMICSAYVWNAVMVRQPKEYESIEVWS